MASCFGVLQNSEKRSERAIEIESSIRLKSKHDSNSRKFIGHVGCELGASFEKYLKKLTVLHPTGAIKSKFISHGCDRGANFGDAAFLSLVFQYNDKLIFLVDIKRTEGGKRGGNQSTANGSVGEQLRGETAFLACMCVCVKRGGFPNGFLGLFYTK